MEFRHVAWSGLTFFLLAACAREDGVETPSSTTGAQAEIRDAGGRLLANASADEAGGVRVRVEAAGLAPGTYAVHVHAVGRCDPPDFATAGPHWNPTTRQHGRLNPMGPHLGDLPNLSVGTDGAGTVEFTVAGASLRRGGQMLLDGDGASLVVHANPDDYRTDPSGSSGARIACGILN
jgi:superoxide dismutase, Cu-Zn family